MSVSATEHLQSATGAASPMPRPSRVLAALTGAALVAALMAAPAGAEKYPVTRQALTADAGFLAYAPAPAQPAAICLVDSGVDLTRDTQGPVTVREALDGGTVDDVDADHHGTLMAMLATAPANDFGMVGAWPAGHLVSVRAERPDGTFAISDYTDAISRCTREAARTGVKVINLSLGSQGELTPGSQETIDDAITRARQLGVNVVAAAGNSGGALDSPASRPAAFAVGAVNASSAFCAFSARGAGLDLAAPGCDLSVAVPTTGEPASATGTSEAAAFVSAVLTALRSYAPQLGTDDAEALLQQTARTTSAGLVLDVGAAFAAAGLQSVVDAGNARTPKATAPPGPMSSAGTSPGLAPGRNGSAAGQERAVATAALAAPRAHATYRRGRLRLSLRGRPAGVALRIDVFAATRGGLVLRVRTVRRTGSRVALRLASWDHLLLSYEDLYGGRDDSRVVRVRHTRAYPPRR